MMRLRLHFTLIFAAKISRHFIYNNIKISTQTHSVNGPLGSGFLLQRKRDILHNYLPQKYIRLSHIILLILQLNGLC